MTKVVKALAASGLFAMVALALVALPMGAKTVDAQSPPAPPSAFYGDVMVDGSLVGSNVLIEAVVDGTVCGSDYTDGSSVYSLYVESMQPDAPNCGVSGDTVLFYIGGVATGQLGGSGVWNNSIAQEENLSYTNPTATPSATVTSGTPGTGTPGTGTPGAGTATKTATPKAPSTGIGTAGDDSGAPAWLFAAIGLGAVAFGASGMAVARRSR